MKNSKSSLILESLFSLRDSKVHEGAVSTDIKDSLKCIKHTKTYKELWEFANSIGFNCDYNGKKSSELSGSVEYYLDSKGVKEIEVVFNDNNGVSISMWLDVDNSHITLDTFGGFPQDEPDVYDEDNPYAAWDYRTSKVYSAKYAKFKAFTQKLAKVFKSEDIVVK